MIDSDLLFFRRPDFLVSWLTAPTRPLHAVDFTESYGYSRPLLEQLAGNLADQSALYVILRADNQLGRGLAAC